VEGFTSFEEGNLPLVPEGSETRRAAQSLLVETNQTFGKRDHPGCPTTIICYYRTHDRLSSHFHHFHVKGFERNKFA
jgi:hypothetical protein